MEKIYGKMGHTAGSVKLPAFLFWIRKDDVLMKTDITMKLNTSNNQSRTLAWIDVIVDQILAINRIKLVKRYDGNGYTLHMPGYQKADRWVRHCEIYDEKIYGELTEAIIEAYEKKTNVKEGDNQ